MENSLIKVRDSSTHYIPMYIHSIYNKYKEFCNPSSIYDNFPIEHLKALFS